MSLHPRKTRIEFCLIVILNIKQSLSVFIASCLFYIYLSTLVVTLVSYVIPKIQVALMFLLEHSIMNQKNILNHMFLYFILGMGKTEPVMLLSCS